MSYKLHKTLNDFFSTQLEFRQLNSLNALNVCWAFPATTKKKQIEFTLINLTIQTRWIHLPTPFELS